MLEANFSEILITSASRSDFSRNDEGQAPLARDALQRRNSAVLERDPRSCDQVPDRPRDEDLTRARARRNARSDVYRDPCDLVVQPLDLAGVQAGAHIKAERPDRFHDRAPAPD